MIIRKIEYVFLSLAIYSDHYPQNYAISYIGTDISQPEIHAHAQVTNYKVGPPFCGYRGNDLHYAIFYKDCYYTADKKEFCSVLWHSKSKIAICQVFWCIFLRLDNFKL
uniref:Uncharacterized protein n=2 Tax=Lactuca sativa TaxID=4236 RepID=A0A9R1XE06_LACSA|nr:hypothetical protein LSAT_V11C500249050 [Lactuca sativa]KAJ0223443.1 hypothetical protein LSAT_V11C200069070 [Lactuca sativa]